MNVQKSIDSLHENFDSLNTAQEKTVLDVHQNHETIELLQNECRNLTAENSLLKSELTMVKAALMTHDHDIDLLK